jgi:hypothetical protein
MRTSFGHEFHIPKQEKTCLNQRVSGNIYMHDGVFRHILAMLCEMFSITPIMNNGYVEEDPLHGLHARQILILWIFTCGVA